MAPLSATASACCVGHIGLGSERHLRGMNRFVYDLTEIADRLRFLPLDERGAYRRQAAVL